MVEPMLRKLQEFNQQRRMKHQELICIIHNNFVVVFMTLPQIFPVFYSDNSVTSALTVHGGIPLLFISPCWIPFAPLSSPLYLLGNPPSCDRIRPPWSPVACKLNSSFPSPCPYTPHSKIPTPRGFSHPNIHSLGWHREPGSQSPAQLGRLKVVSLSRPDFGEVLLQVFTFLKTLIPMCVPAAALHKASFLTYQ